MGFCDRNVSSFGQIEQDEYQIRISLIYSTRPNIRTICYNSFLLIECLHTAPNFSKGLLGRKEPVIHSKILQTGRGMPKDTCEIWTYSLLIV